MGTKYFLVNSLLFPTYFSIVHISRLGLYNKFYIVMIYLFVDHILRLGLYDKLYCYNFILRWYYGNYGKNFDLAQTFHVGRHTFLVIKTANGIGPFSSILHLETNL